MTLDPFTHIYMFDTGFPPDLLKHIAGLFNKSTTATTLVSFSTVATVRELGFNVDTESCGLLCATQVVKCTSPALESKLWMPLATRRTQTAAS